MPNAPDDVNGASSAIGRLHDLFDKSKLRRASLKEFIVAFRGPAPSIDDDHAYMAWVSDCAIFFYEQPDPIATADIIEALLEDHSRFSSILRNPTYPTLISRAYALGPEELRKALFALAQVTP